MRYFMGIDGGGSNLRIAITDEQLNPIAEFQSTTANPNLIGHDNAAKHIQSAIVTVLSQANLSHHDISAVGIGIAGASNLHSTDWLIATVKPALLDSFLVPSSDLEIALVGALAQRHGILVLAGTGSAVFGISPDRTVLQIGGWGYLLGDEGSGYWIGLQALKRIIRDFEGNYAPLVQSRESALNAKILHHLGLNSARDIIRWLYNQDTAPTTRVGHLAKLVIEEAENDNFDAVNLLQSASIQLHERVDLMRRRLAYPDAPIAFAGGLLDNDNRLSTELFQRLQLPHRPISRYSPVIGGALLAKMEWTRHHEP